MSSLLPEIPAGLRYGVDLDRLRKHVLPMHPDSHANTKAMEKDGKEKSHANQEKEREFPLTGWRGGGAN